MSRKRLPKSGSMEKLSVERNTWTPLAPPDYIIDPDFLIDKFVTIETTYFGTLSNLSSEFDLKKRNEAIRMIDSARKSQQISANEPASFVTISAYNIKFIKRLNPENLILRIPMEQIKSVAYVKDDSTHYVLILYGILSDRNTTPSLNLTISSTESRMKAEEICCLINQCFQIIYTEATVRHFDRQTKNVNSVNKSNIEKIYGNIKLNQKMTSKHSKDLYDENRSAYEFESVYSDLSSSKADFLQNFMGQLTNVLQKDEMLRFAECLSAWQQGAPFETFCSQMQQLLGPDRIGILANMRNFIDPADWFTLEQFLNDFSPHSKSYSPLAANWSQLIAKNPLPPFHMQRSLSYASTSNGVLSIYDEENSVRDDMSPVMKNVSNSNKWLANESSDNTEFSKAIDTLFNKVGDLELILSSDK